jgi:hypothetical protein
MKTSTKILIALAIVLSLLIGFFIGITVDYPKADTSELAGTIGKVNNYRNVKVTENDVQLRSELLSNKAMLTSYSQFYSFHYTSCVKLVKDIDFAIQAAEGTALFKGSYSLEIENLKQFREILDQARKDLLLALTSLQKLSESDDNDIAMFINNANIAIAQIKYKQNDVLAFVESIEKFLQGNNPEQFSDLLKAHDLLSVNQIVAAAVTNDKPMLKAYNKKQLLTAKENTNLACLSQEDLNKAIASDMGDLRSSFDNNEKVVGLVGNAGAIGATEKQLGIIIPAVEKLGLLIVLSSEKLGAANAEKLGAWNVEKLGIILNTEKLGTILNSEKLGIDNAENLGIYNMEKLGVCNVETLRASFP